MEGFIGVAPCGVDKDAQLYPEEIVRQPGILMNANTGRGLMFNNAFKENTNSLRPTVTSTSLITLLKHYNPKNNFIFMVKNINIIKKLKIFILYN